MKYIILYLCLFTTFVSQVLAIDFKEAPKIQKRITPQLDNDTLYSFNSSIEQAKKQW